MRFLSGSGQNQHPSVEISILPHPRRRFRICHRHHNICHLNASISDPRPFLIGTEALNLLTELHGYVFKRKSLIFFRTRLALPWGHAYNLAPRTATPAVETVAHSSRGPGRRPLTPVTRVRIPYALPTFPSPRQLLPEAYASIPQHTDSSLRSFLRRFPGAFSHAQKNRPQGSSSRIPFSDFNTLISTEPAEKPVEKAV